MTREQTFDKLYSLKLHGLSDALEKQLENPEMDGLGFEERLALLVDAQYLWRENRAYATRLRQAHLKTAASIEDLNYRHARKLDRSLVQSLATCEWIRRHHNLTIIGASGLGKTYLCCAFLEKACREGFRAHYASASKFFRQLGMAWADGSFDRLLAKLARTDVLAIDDFGLVALTDLERRHLLEVLDDRTQSRSTILTSQFPVENWHELVGSPTLADAIVERILANSHRIELEGETLRRIEAKEVTS
jgi:DNA replication protein DnaC